MLKYTDKKGTLAATLFFTVGYIFCNVRYPLIVQKIVDTVASGEGGERLETIFPLFFALLLVIVLLIFCCRGQELFQTKYLNQVRSFYRVGMTDGIFARFREGISSQQEAELLSVFNNDIPMICSDYYETGLNIFYSAVMILFSLSALVQINIWMMLLILLNFVLLAIVPHLFKKKLQQKKGEISDTLKHFNLCIKDYIFCLPMTRACLAYRQMRERVKCSSDQNDEATYSHEKVQANANLFSMLVGYSNDFLVVLIGVWLIFQGKMTVGALLAVIQISGLLANPITTISYQIVTRKAVLPLKQKVEQMMQTPSDNLEHGKTLSQIDRISLKNVGVNRGEDCVLHDISLDLEYGKKYLLVGKNGSGKSTLLKLIHGDILADSGEIMIDSSPIDQVSFRDYYRLESIVYQQNYLFNDSVKNNITLFQPYQQERLEELIQQLDLHQLISREISEIDRLSGGEKQRIVLARALLKNPRFLLLDEAFSALDSQRREQTERQILNQSGAVINISHSYCLENMERYDEIIVLENGTILEKGKYSELSTNVKELFCVEEKAAF